MLPIPGRWFSRRLRPAHVGAHVLLLALSILILAPYLWAVFASFKPPTEAGSPNLLPHMWTLDEYRAVITFPASAFYASYMSISFAQEFLHSSIVAVSVTLAAMVTSTLVGFVLTVYRFRGKEILFILLIVTFMVPLVCIFIPLYVTVVHLGLNNSLGALIVTGLWSPLGILVIRQFMEGVPTEMLEAARIDGAGELRLVVQMILPLCTSALGVLAVYTFMHSWDDFFWPSIAVHDPSQLTLTLLENYFSTNPDSFPVPFVMASAMLTILPILAIYAFVARFFIRGIGAIVVQI